MHIKPRAVSETTMVEGDRVTCSISHQIRIDGEQSWVKFEANLGVLPDEPDNQAIERVVGLTNKAVMSAINTTVETVKER